MLQLKVAGSRAFVGGPRPLPALPSVLRPVPPCRVTPFRAVRLTVVAEVAAAERLRLHNLSPSKGSRRPNKRKGRGHAAGQGGTCGFGNRGQKSRSGPGPRPGFEGGQTPLYRRLPKLRGIAGGMKKGLPKFVIVNLEDLNKKFKAGDEVSLESIQEKRLFKLSGSEKKLPLKVLGDGELAQPLNIKAAAFSASALDKIKAAGGVAEVLPQRVKWTRKAHEKNVKELKEKGLDYNEEKVKRKIARLKAKGIEPKIKTPKKKPAAAKK